MHNLIGKELTGGYLWANSPVGTCEQRDTGQGHPNKCTGHRSITTPNFAGTVRYVCDAEKMAKINH